MDPNERDAREMAQLEAIARACARDPRRFVAYLQSAPAPPAMVTKILVAKLCLEHAWDALRLAVERGALDARHEIHAGAALIHMAAGGGGRGSVDFLRCLVRHGEDPNRVEGASCVDVVNDGWEMGLKGPSSVYPFIYISMCHEKRRQRAKKAKAQAQAWQREQEGEDDEALLEAALTDLGMGESKEDGEDDEDESEEEAAAAAAAGAPAGADTPAATTVVGVECPPPLEDFLEASTPENLLCPITLELLDDPVVLLGDGCTYSRAAIEQHLGLCRKRGKPLISPKTNLVVKPACVILAENVALRAIVLDFKEQATREWEALERRWQESQMT